MSRAFNHAEAGPLALLAMSRLGGVVASDRVGRLMARAALQCLETSDIRDDAALLAAGDHGLARIVRGAIQSCDGLDAADRERLVALTPKPLQEPLAALVERRAHQPDEPPEAALEAVLAEAWDNGLRDAVRAELESLARPPARLAQGTDATATE